MSIYNKIFKWSFPYLHWLFVFIICICYKHNRRYKASDEAEVAYGI